MADKNKTELTEKVTNKLDSKKTEASKKEPKLAKKKNNKEIATDVQKKYFKPQSNPSLAYPAKSVPLSQDEIEKLEDYERILPEDSKRIKKTRKSFALEIKQKFKIKKKFTSKVNKKVYFIRKGEIKNLRERYGDDFDSFKSSLLRRKNFLTTLIIVLLIIAIFGVGGFIGYKYLFNKTPENIIITGDVMFNDIGTNISDARLNTDIQKEVTVTNDTNGELYVRFIINIKDEDGILLDKSFYNIDVDYQYNSNFWYLDTNNKYLYFKGKLSSKDKVQIITSFKITSADKNENVWANKTIKVTFEVECAEASGESVLQDLITKGWSYNWASLFNT